MPTEFERGHITTQDDLDIEVVDGSSQPIDPYLVTYALYDVTTGVEVLIGPSQRNPVRIELGHYYAHFQIPENAAYGLYRIRWTLQETSSSSQNTVLQEFTVVTEDIIKLSQYTSTELDMIRRFRILLRDQNPDRYYHFRPPTSSGTVNEFNRVFAYIWENEELIEYMEQAVFAINASPPETGYGSMDQMIQAKPNWRNWIITGAMVHAAIALTLNWIADEFSLGAEVPVQVTLPDGRILDVPIGELFDICEGSEDA